MSTAQASPTDVVCSDAAHRQVAARVLGIAGVISYNWWIVVPIIPGMMPSRNGFFSDLEVAGRPHANLLLNADLAAALLMVTALLLRGPNSQRGHRAEWYWMLVFAISGAIGSRYPYACSEGLSATCRHLEWTGQLPWHHYLHMGAGVIEFAALTIAAVLASRRTANASTPTSHAYRAVLIALLVGYPLLGAVYLTDRLGTFVEPLFFVVFCAMVLTELFEAPASSFPPAQIADPATSAVTEH
jgi:hypothetical protein